MENMFYALSLASNSGRHVSAMFVCPSRGKPRANHVFGPLSRAFKFETTIDAILFKGRFPSLKDAQYKVIIVPIVQRPDKSWVMA